MELGVHCVSRLRRQSVDQRLKGWLRVNPNRVHEGEVPVANGRPLNAQAIVPPATLIVTTSTPSRNSQARRLRPPPLQIT
jgi:hypothetical protein